MATNSTIEIEKIKVPSGTTYNVKDEWVRAQIKAVKEKGMNYVGYTTTALSDGDTTNPIKVDGKDYTAVKGDLVIYYTEARGDMEYLFSGTLWDELGSTGTVKALAYADTATGSTSCTMLNNGSSSATNGITYDKATKFTFSIPGSFSFTNSGNTKAAVTFTGATTSYNQFTQGTSKTDYITATASNFSVSNSTTTSAVASVSATTDTAITGFGPTNKMVNIATIYGVHSDSSSTASLAPTFTAVTEGTDSSLTPGDLPSMTFNVSDDGVLAITWDAGSQDTYTNGTATQVTLPAASAYTSKAVPVQDTAATNIVKGIRDLSGSETGDIITKVTPTTKAVVTGINTTKKTITTAMSITQPTINLAIGSNSISAPSGELAPGFYDTSGNLVMTWEDVYTKYHSIIAGSGGTTTACITGSTAAGWTITGYSYTATKQTGPSSWETITAYNSPFAYSKPTGTILVLPANTKLAAYALGYSYSSNLNSYVTKVILQQSIGVTVNTGTGNYLVNTNAFSNYTQTINLNMTDEQYTDYYSKCPSAIQTKLASATNIQASASTVAITSEVWSNVATTPSVSQPSGTIAIPDGVTISTNSVAVTPTNTSTSFTGSVTVGTNTATHSVTVTAD